MLFDNLSRRRCTCREDTGCWVLSLCSLSCTLGVRSGCVSNRSPPKCGVHKSSAAYDHRLRSVFRIFPIFGHPLENAIRAYPSALGVNWTPARIAPSLKSSKSLKWQASNEDGECQRVDSVIIGGGNKLGVMKATGMISSTPAVHSIRRFMNILQRVPQLCELSRDSLPFLPEVPAVACSGFAPPGRIFEIPQNAAHDEGERTWQTTR